MHRRSAARSFELSGPYGADALLVPVRNDLDGVTYARKSAEISSVSPWGIDLYPVLIVARLTNFHQKRILYVIPVLGSQHPHSK